jgi:undecaprenyl diphosphate synthase
MTKEIRGPFSVGIIMDGNRRWAKAGGETTSVGHAVGFGGHSAGEGALLKLLDEYRSLREKWGTAHYIFYAFSTENWSRSAEEVASLIGIFEKAFKKIEDRLPQILEDGVRVRFIGERERFSTNLQLLMKNLEEKTSAGKEGTFAIAVSYGGRADIIQAVNTLIEKETETVTEKDISTSLWTHEIPEPDLIIRTGGDQRLSNFLMWESAYAELFFTNTLWPDFSRDELERIFEDFSTRERRHGR